MIRQNQPEDQFDNLKYGSVISYPAGKRHFYRDFLVLGKTKDEITTVPLILCNNGQMNRFDVHTSPAINQRLHGAYYTSTLDVNLVSKAKYNRVNGVHILNLSQTEIAEHDQKSSAQITLAKQQYAAWLKIKHSKAVITKKHQKLRAGIKNNRLLTTDNLKPYLLSKYLTGETKNDKYEIASYVDQTYKGTIAPNDSQATTKLCNKFANVDKLRKYDIIRYRAITGDHVKWRPFIVMGRNRQSVDLVPITHTRYAKRNNTDKGIYTIYHVNLSPKISRAISIMNGDGREQSKQARTSLSPCTQITVALQTFKNKQLPQYLGNLKDHASMTEINQMENDKNDTIKDLMTSFENFQIEQKAFGHIRNYEEKLFARKSINERDLSRILDKSGTGQFEHQQNLSPIYDRNYQYLKQHHLIKYGLYQSSKLKKKPITKRVPMPVDLTPTTPTSKPEPEMEL